MEGGLSALLTAIGSVATSIIEQAGNVFSMVGEQPVLQIGLGIFVVGAVVGMTRRIIGAF